ncbi:MAG TPA: guanylate kinase [bacterium]|jgi:guanylate kinase|nr:guanylate kinase [bacterium]
MPQGLLLVVSGPSGCGKGTVCDLLRERNPKLAYSISATTRKARPGEKDGIDYFFLTPDEFKLRSQQKEFLEQAKVFGHWYGTPRTWVEEKLSTGRDVLLEIEPQGALQIKANYPVGILLFLLPPNWSELKRRINGRGTERADEIALRLRMAKQEIEQICNYDYFVINREVKKAVFEIEAILLAEHCRVNRYNKQKLKAMLEG